VVVCDRHRTDDVEAVATIEIAVDGARQRIDVCAEHLAEFRRLVRPFTGRATGAASGARRATKRTTKGAAGRSRPKRRPKAEIAALRAWAKANGYTLAERGRVPTAVREAYEAATG
jgi:hypothetical protein